VVIYVRMSPRVVLKPRESLAVVMKIIQAGLDMIYNYVILL